VALAQNKIRFDVGKRAASLFRLVDGGPQILTAFPGGTDVALGDIATAEVIRMGRVFTNDWEKEQSEAVAFSEVVTAEIT
jgi:hypothetical protein